LTSFTGLKGKDELQRDEMDMRMRNRYSQRQLLKDEGRMVE
jgi:hypothetical protein